MEVTTTIECAQRALKGGHSSRCTRQDMAALPLDLLMRGRSGGEQGTLEAALCALHCPCDLTFRAHSSGRKGPCSPRGGAG